jgi:hypothetical protein
MLLILVHWKEAYILLKKNTDASVVGSKETGLAVNADKTQYMVMSGDENTGRSDNTDSSSFERVEEFRYVGKTFTNQNSI